MKYSLFTSVFLMLLLASCQNDNCYYDECDKATEKCDFINGKVISIDEAVSNLESIIGELYLGTRANKRPKFSSSNMITLVLPPATRTSTLIELPDTLVYIQPFDDNAGYAILSARTTISPILAITESGCFDMNKFNQAIEYEINNNVLSREEYQQLIDDIEEDGDDFEEFAVDPTDLAYALTANVIVGDLIGGGIETPTDEIIDYELPAVLQSTETIVDYEILEFCAPLLTTKWNQRSPFNLLCKDGDVYCPVGCTVTAVSQIMAANEYPKNRAFNGELVDWTVAKEYSPNDYYSLDYDIDLEEDEVARQLSNICFELGKPENCDVSYGVNGSKSTAAKAKNAFINMGYINVDKRLGFAKADREATIEMIRDGKPVYVSAHKFIPKGHAMVYDGYVERRKRTSKYYYYTDGTCRVNRTYDDPQQLFHINWGYSGSYDGYYLAKSSVDNKEYYATETDIDYATLPNDAEHLSYSHYFRVVTYDIPNE
ncbi:MAG: C10 family peptidase [Alistipes sp.]|nr:C10 family peptidase [Alistipes sp.]MBR6632293.1 C10 family peptidase [Alistipes sp.]